MGKPGYVYLLRLEQDKDPAKCVYKIGRTTDLKNRHKMIGVLMPYPVTLVWAHNLEDAEDGERFIHEQLKHNRINGEWFTFNESAISTFLRVGLGVDAEDELIEQFINCSMTYDFFWGVVDGIARLNALKSQ